MALGEVIVWLLFFTLLAGQLRQPLEQVVAVGRPLAQQQEQGRLGETLDPCEDAPAAAVMPQTFGSSLTKAQLADLVSFIVGAK